MDGILELLLILILVVTSLDAMSGRPTTGTDTMCIPYMSTKPTMTDLEGLKRRDGNGHLKIMQWITSLPDMDRIDFIDRLSSGSHACDIIQRFSGPFVDRPYDTIKVSLHMWIEDNECSWDALIDCVKPIDPHFAWLLRMNIPEGKHM